MSFYCGVRKGAINFIVNEIIVMYFLRNDGRRKREEQKNKAINFRQKEKDILDNILGKQESE